MSNRFLLVSTLALGFIYYPGAGEIAVQLAVSGSGLDENQGLVQSKGPIQLEVCFLGKA